MDLPAHGEYYIFLTRVMHLNRTVLVTGGSGTIGQAIVRQFASNGYLTYFQYNLSNDIASQLSDSCGAIPIQMQFHNDNFIGSLPSVDIVVNNAGVNPFSRSVHQIDVSEWDYVHRINSTIPFLISKYYLPSMVTKGWGRIINIGSIYSIRASLLNSAYISSKHSLSGLTKAIAKEYASKGVTCNEVLPGPVQSSLLEKVARSKAETEGVTSIEYISALTDGIPSKQLALPRDVASIVFVLSQIESSHINGTSITVDGGATA